MARDAMVDMRMLVFELHPPRLEEEGLAAALQVRLASVETRAGLQTEMHVEGERRLPLSVEEELYWIAQEALNNVVKHAQAKQVTVFLQFGENGVCLEVRDDGVGFEPAKSGQSGGIGLRSMEERAQRIRGRLEIESAPRQGTTVRVRAMIPESQEVSL
jgi:signal transduction histidine kinase